MWTASEQHSAHNSKNYTSALIFDKSDIWRNKTIKLDGPMSAQSSRAFLRFDKSGGQYWQRGQLNASF